MGVDEQTNRDPISVSLSLINNLPSRNLVRVGKDSIISFSFIFPGKLMETFPPYRGGVVVNELANDLDRTELLKVFIINNNYPET